MSGTGLGAGRLARAGAARAPAPGRVTVIGIGNSWRGDDAAGLAVASLVRAARRPGVEAIGFEGEPVSLLGTWAAQDTVYLADAVGPDGEPGRLYRFDAAAGLPPGPLRRRGTHTFSIADAIELARALGELPRRLVVYGIEGAVFRTGAPLSPRVRRAAAEVSARILAELAAHGGGR